jgi:hypothetical protein
MYVCMYVFMRMHVCVCIYNGAEITSSRVFQLGSMYVYVCVYMHENVCMCMYI